MATRKAKKRVKSGVVRRKRPAKRKTKATLAAAFLAGVDRETRDTLARTISLPDFRAQATTAFDRDDRLRLLGQAILLLEDNYAHLPLKQAMHAVRPLQRLRLLRSQVEQDSGPATDAAFHAEMLSIFISLRDLHTNYILPSPFNVMVAFVPFQLENYFENGQRRYLVSRLVGGFTDPFFGPGVEVTTWNGIAIARAVELNADRFAGSNAPARLARGVEGMTIRSLITALPPDEDWVVVGYRGPDDVDREIRLDWLVFEPDQMASIGDVLSGEGENATRLGVDIERDCVRLAKRTLFAPKAVAMDRKVEAGAASAAVAADDIATQLPSVLTAREVDTPSGRFGYLRIRTFSVDDVDGFIDEVRRLLELIPQEGLIIDVRGNGGGNITAGERMLQLLTPREIEPEPVQFINTSENLAICRRHSPSPIFIDFDLSPWTESIEDAVKTGAIFSRAFPITPTDEANSVGQVYHGPVVLITDALCYSTTDIFAAGFQDHEIGPVLGVDGNTGAGGANVWTHSLLQRIADPNGSYEDLPGDTQMRVSIRRTLRVGERSGTPVEDLGVVPDHQHDMTRRDLLEGNVDLIAAAARLLADLPFRQLEIRVTDSDSDGISVTLTTSSIEYVDVYANGRPIGSIDVSDGETDLILEDAEDGTLEFTGFAEGRIVARAVVSTS